MEMETPTEKWKLVCVLSILAVVLILEFSSLQNQQQFKRKRPNFKHNYMNKTAKISSVIVPCHKNGYLTMFNGGQLGNQMSHYATLFAHSKRLGVKTVLPAGSRRVLTKHFKNISTPPKAENCNWNWTDLYMPDVYKLTSADFETKNIKIFWYVFDFEGFRFYQHQLITEEFAFDKSMLLDTQNILTKIKSQTNMTTIFVSVHVRRTDYKEWMSKHALGFVASKKFYLEAMNIYRTKYNNNQTCVKFILASDDYKWCREMFANETDVIFTSSFDTVYSKVQPTYDLALLSRCNHSIISFGTFGFWTAFLKGRGDVIMVTGTYQRRPYVEENLRPFAHNWIFLQDPCYTTDKENNVILLDECKNLN